MTQTTPQPDPADPAELAALYVTGALAPDDREAFEHEVRAGNAAYRAALADLEPAVNILTERIEPIAPSPETRAGVLAISGTDAANSHEHTWTDWEGDELLAGGLFTLKSSEGDWEDTGVDGISVRKLFVDRANHRMTAMFRMAPGTAYVPHIHDQAEECYVLEGDLHVGDEIVMHAGDYQRAEAGSEHGVQRTEGGCLLLITCSLSDELT